jgi:D-alanyl-D-alanine carboxypeptidase/D-alanyl-D-alanine-endopeptidase (penicillin-binding protein 4)
VRRWFAGGLALVIAVAALLLVLGGTLNRTSTRDATPRPGGQPVTTGTGHHTADGTTTTRSSTSTTTATTPTSPTLGTGGSDSAPSAGPGEVTLERSLKRSLSSAGPNVGALVYDLSSGRELFAIHPTVERAPASVEKIWTTVALMDRLGPGARLQTVILGTGGQHGGVWHGNLYLRGGGDPTFGDTEFNVVWNHGEGPTAAQIVAQLRHRGIRRITGRLYADASLFDDKRGGLLTGQKPDIPDLEGQLSALTYDHGTTLPHYNPATFTAHEVALTMRGSDIRVTAATRTRRTPDSAQLLASVSSPTMLQMTTLMDVPSDDFFAEMFAKQLGVLFGKAGTISDGAKVISQTIASQYDLHPLILDGSGLSHKDRTSPLQIVELLRDLWGSPVGAELSESLPVTGMSGTVASIGVHGPAQGRCQAKTGSLDYVTNLAGYCRTKSGQKLAFGIFVDGPDNAVGFALESRMVGAIARY